ncbi:hypothetical protein Scep_009795 [Stephania cephalantha]|uniref:Uncharacterized protein n=1 Tax=Stephania cephalantha TaxID=152367 RepID=A0AAP0JUI5_9MAGN
MVFFFSVTTPFGIALGIALSSVYKENSPSSLIMVGLLNASSAGLLIYMARVDIPPSDFMGPKLQGSIKLQIKAYIAVLLGAGGISRRINDGEMADVRAPASARAAALTEARGDARVRAQTEESRERESRER